MLAGFAQIEFTPPLGTQMPGNFKGYEAKTSNGGLFANAAAVSERECSRCFQRCFRESAITYLNKYRVRVAAAMLLKGQDSIRSISQQCGFCSDSYFGRQFRQMLGCTPKEYRRKASGSGEDPQ